MFSPRTLAVGIISCALGAVGARMLPVAAAQQQPSGSSPITATLGPKGLTLTTNARGNFLVVQGSTEQGRSGLLRLATKQTVLPNTGKIVIYEYTRGWTVRDGTLHPCVPSEHCPPDPPGPPPAGTEPCPFTSVRFGELWGEK